ncbi:MAG: 4-phosphoerythronate dehydrogenase [Muribaculaceae bacterium]|nr:4-phosphoerythronate dehydrogenase [Muribaculaceae bacterium]
MKVVADRNVPYLGNLARVADLEALDADEITPAKVRDADALIVRTRTRCDEALLRGSKVRFVGTATIGTDHIDREACEALGVTVANAPGSNAPAVAQYVFSSIMRLINRPLGSYTIGIVGVGNVGSIVERWAKAMDMQVLLCDPPRAAAEGAEGFVSLEDIARRADIITFHTPLTVDGEFPTYHMAGEEFFRSLRRAPIIINSARGPVTDTAAWVRALREGIAGPAVVDCWEGEPAIDPDLLRAASIATPHIAGYSAPGKARATAMVLEALSRCFGLDKIEPDTDPIPSVAASITPAEALRCYDPIADTEALRACPADFERLRNTYALRPEPRECQSN